MDKTIDQNDTFLSGDQYMEKALRTIGSKFDNKAKVVKKNGAYLFGTPS